MSSRAHPSGLTLVKRIVVAEWLKVVLHPHGARFHVAFAILSLGGAALMGFIARQAVVHQGAGADRAFLVAPFSTIGLLLPGVLVAMTACAYRTASEYDDGTVSETYRALPGRVLAFCVKTALLATSFALPTLLLMPLCYLVTESVAASEVVYPAAILSQGGLQALLTVPVVVWCLCAMAAAVASTVRNSAVAIAVLITWYALVEELVPDLPVVGARIGSLMPVANGWAFAGVEDGVHAVGPAWAGLGVLVAWLVAAVAVAAVLLVRRDVPARS